MNQIIDLVIRNPKTTISGACSFVAITALGMLPFVHDPKINTALAMAAALAKLYIAAISKDAKN